jgi:hypothetical protein
MGKVESMVAILENEREENRRLTDAEMYDDYEERWIKMNCFRGRDDY